VARAPGKKMMVCVVLVDRKWDNIIMLLRRLVGGGFLEEEWGGQQRMRDKGLVEEVGRGSR